MTYATITDIFSRYRPIATLIGSEDLQITSVNVASVFIADAESFIDARIGGRYSVPLSIVPPFIVQITSDIAIFNMLTDHLPGKPDFFQPRYDRALAMLDMVSSGSLIVNSAAVIATGDSEAWSTTQGYHSVFSPVLDTDYQSVDTQRAEADYQERLDDNGVTQS